jgi:hypothetical protein
MNTIDILVIVDTGHALSSNNLSNFVLLVDDTSDNKLVASNELSTPVANGQTIQWRAVAIDDGQELTIKSFQGTAVSDGVIEPKPSASGNDTFWSSEVETRTASTYQYTMTLTIEGKDMTFDPFLVVSV